MWTLMAVEVTHLVLAETMSPNWVQHAVPWEWNGYSIRYWAMRQDRDSQTEKGKFDDMVTLELSSSSN